MSILYRIVDPYVVFTKLGPGRLFESNGIVPKAEPLLKQALGELTTEEFYNSPLRTSKVDLARETIPVTHGCVGATASLWKIGLAAEYSVAAVNTLSLMIDFHTGPNPPSR